MAQIKVKEFLTHQPVKIRGTLERFFPPVENSKGRSLEYLYDTAVGLMKVTDVSKGESFYITAANISQFWIGKEEAVVAPLVETKVKPKAKEQTPA